MAIVTKEQVIDSWGMLIENAQDRSNEVRNHGSDEEPVGRTGIVLFACYFIALSFLLLYNLMWFWPAPGSDIKSVFLIVLLSGTLGGQMHALRLFYWYVGNRKLVWS